jgi:hypothetical protein
MSDDIDKLIEQIDIPQEWEASEGSAYSVLLEYVKHLEATVEELGGTLMPGRGVEMTLLGRFYSKAVKHVTTEDTDDWNNMIDAWNVYQHEREKNQ